MDQIAYEDRLHRQRLVRQSERAMAVMRAALLSKPEPAQAEPARKPFRQIIRDTAREHNVGPADILSSSRYRNIVVARHEAIRRVAAAYPKFSTPKLGRIFGRSHWTILHALGRLGRQKK